MSLQSRVGYAYQVMSEGKEVVLKSYAPTFEGGVSLRYLEGIAKLRYALIVVAELLYCQYGANSREDRNQSFYSHETQLLLDVAKRCCDDDVVNINNTGPAVFLVKQIAQQFGISFLIKLTSDKTMQWVVPHHLRIPEVIKQHITILDHFNV